MILKSGQCRTCGVVLSTKTLRLIRIKAIVADVDPDMLDTLLPRCTLCLKLELRRRGGQ